MDMRTFGVRRLVAAMVMVSVGACAALAQQTPPTPTPTPTPTPAGPSVDEKPAAGVAPAPMTPPALSSDTEIAAIQLMLVGSLATKAAGEGDSEPALTWNAAAVNVGGLDNAVYFEVARRDDAGNPFRSGILHVYRRQGQVRLRVFELAGQPTFRDAVVGLWLAPAMFPKITSDDLRPQLDLVQQVGSGPGVWVGATAAPVATARGGAVEMTSELALRPGSISVADRGVDVAGKQVWGPSAGKTTVFERTSPLGRVEVQPSGLAIITLVAPAADALKLAEGGTVVFHYSGHLGDGYVFDTSRMEGRQPFRVTVPANIPPGINIGLTNIGIGERRRIVIPPALGYGEAGSRAGRVPPNSTLYFDIECLMVESPPPPAAPTPATPAGEAAPAGK